MLFVARWKGLMHPDIRNYNDQQAPRDKAICDLLAAVIDLKLRKPRAVGTLSSRSYSIK
jgi:hypothetical protein